MLMRLEIDRGKRKMLDELYNALSVVAEGSYVFVTDLESDMSRWSKEAVDLFGLPGEYMNNVGDMWAEHIHPDDREEYRDSIGRIYMGSDDSHDMQYRARTKKGTYVVCTCKGVVIKDVKGKPAYFGGAIKNHGIQSYVDTVTGLRSLYGFFQDLRDIFLNKEETVIMQVGLSNFSSYNEVFGYSFGNRILQQLGRMLQKLFENTGLVYRMDGTKFAVITHTLNKDEVAGLYEKLRDTAGKDFYIDGHRIGAALNAGAVVVDNFDITDKTVYSCLKYAYYTSKNTKMGDFVLFEDSLNDENRHKLDKLRVIRESITENCDGFFLCYQPVVDAETERLKGVEALIRWENDEYGMVSPNDFIPVLEQDPLFPKLGTWILRKAMADGKKMLEKYPDIKINVNLSYAQMEKDGFVEEVTEAVRDLDFPPENLCLEITERCRLMDKELLKDIVTLLKDIGIAIAMDDFGNGFSSLGTMREIRPDIVKVDRAMVRNIESNQTDKSTVRYISELADGFDAELCVEGVENAQMRDILREYNVKSLQGYYYSKPVPFDELCALEI